MIDRFHLHICIPSSGYCRTKFALCLSLLVACVARTPLHDGILEQTVQVHLMEGSCISQNRETLVQDALADGASHILFIDDDMRFSPDCLYSLARHDLPIVGCNYPFRKKDADFTAVDLQGNRLPVTEEATGVQEVWSMGFGFCLIQRAVFEAVQHPWFGIYWINHRDKFSTEDAPFMKAARDAGFRSYVDHDASKLIGHVGIFEYDWQNMP